MRDRIRESRAKREPQNDKHRLDTCFESRQQLHQIDLSDINDGKQETIEQHARDQRNDRRYRDHKDRGMEVARDSEIEDGEQRGSEEGGARHPHMEGDHQNISRIHREDGPEAGCDDIAPWHIEHDRKPQCCHSGCQCLHDVQMLRCDRYFGEAGDIRQTDSACDPKGHRQHDEDRVRESRHPGCQVAVQKIIDPIDERHAGDQGERRRHHREKRIRRPGKIHRPIGRERRKERGDGNGDIPIHLKTVAAILHQSSHHRRQHGEERIDSMTAENQTECR